MSEPLSEALTVDQLAGALRHLSDGGAGDTPVQVDVAGHALLPVLRTSVRAHGGQAYLELRTADPAADQDQDDDTAN